MSDANIKALLITSLLLASDVVIAQTSLCANIIDDAARLKCYDNSFKQSKEVGWEIKKTKSGLDDSELITATLANTENNGWLVIRCKERTFNAFVYSTSYLGGDDDIAVVYRMGSGEPISWRWDTSSDGTAAGYWDSSGAKYFVRQLTRERRFFVRLQTSSATSDMTFELGNIREAADAVSAACPD